MPTELRLTGIEPRELLAHIAVGLERYDELVAVAGARGLEHVLTVPASLEPVRRALLETMRARAEEAVAGGAERIDIVLPADPDTVDLLRWYHVRRHLLAPLAAHPDAGESVRFFLRLLGALERATPLEWLGAPGSD